MAFEEMKGGGIFSMIAKENEELRKLLYRKSIKLWQIGAAVGVSEMTVIRWFQEPLTDERREKIGQAIEQILKERACVYRPNAELRALMRLRGYTIPQLADKIGVKHGTMVWWLSRPLTDERRQRIEAGLNAMAMQREGK